MNESEGIHDPDWERYRVTRDGELAPVGDPTRWGAQVVTALDDSMSQPINTPQIIQLATRDGYARAWSVLGTLGLPLLTWNTSDVFVQLEITMGVGQVQITHTIVLVHGALGPAGLPAGVPAVGKGGLCLDQWIFYGGPYNGALDPPSNQARAFAIVGGLVGQSIAIRASYQLNSVPPTPGLPGSSRLALIVTPYAAGEGL